MVNEVKKKEQPVRNKGCMTYLSQEKDEHLKTILPFIKVKSEKKNSKSGIMLARTIGLMTSQPPDQAP